ncbi:BEACH domain containing protein, partial [Euroglyphus maynei]
MVATIGPHKLGKLWQTCQLDSKNEPKEKRNHLIRLLDCCLVYFEELLNDRSATSNQLQRTTHYCIGNWLIHQFIIDLSNLSHSKYCSDQTNRLFDEYFLHDDRGVGFKFLQCFSHFLAHEGGTCIYNIELAKILILVLGHFLDDDNSFSNGSQQQIQTDWSAMASQTNFKEDLYLKTVNRNDEILSPIKVKSWFKSRDSAALFAGKNGQTGNKSLRRNDDSSSSDESDHRVPLKVIVPPCLVTADDNTIEEPAVMTVVANYEKPTKTQLIRILENLLTKFVSMEKNGFRALVQKDRGQVSMLIIRELSYLMHKLVNNIQIIELNHLLLASCMVVCQHRPFVGIELIDRVGLIESWMRYVNRMPSISSNNASIVFDNELIETGNYLLSLMITISKSLTTNLNDSNRATRLFDSFVAFMFGSNHDELDNEDDNSVDGDGDNGDDEKHSNLASFLLNIVRALADQQQLNDPRLYRMINLLKQLHIAIQYSHTLSMHRQICRRKRRHIRCNLAPLIVHHHFHINSLLSRTDNCSSALLYSLLIKVIFILAAKCDGTNESSSTSRLLNYVSQQLAQLISCCCVLRRYCKRLLIIAITTTGPLASSIRHSIFNVIELNVRIQRQHHHHPNKTISSSATQYVDECSFCASSSNDDQSMNEPARSQNEQEPSPLYSEGYATDNGNCCWLSSDHHHHRNKQKLMEGKLTGIESDNFLMSSLSQHYRTLLKSDSIITRQSVYRHLYNLFSFVDDHCQKSILAHVILPVMSDHSQSYPSDVGLFVLRLLIAAAAAATNTSNCNKRKAQPMQLLQMISKLKAWPAIIQYISYWKHHEVSLGTDTYHISNDLACLGIQLLRNLLICELTDSQHKTTIESFETITIITDLFIDHFNECILHKTIQHFETDTSPKMQSLSEYVEFYKHRSFDILIDDPTEEVIKLRINRLSQIIISLNRLSWLANSTIRVYPQFADLLNSEFYQFTPKLWLHFCKLFRQTLNEMKLLSCVSQAREKHWKLCEQLIGLMESLLSLIQRLESSDPLDQFIADQLASLSEMNPILQSNPASESMMTTLVGKLLQMIIRVSFDCSIVNDQHIHGHSIWTNSCTDLLSILDIEKQQRTPSFDSVMSDPNDDCDESFDCNSSYDDGYEADVECLARQTKTIAKETLTTYPALLRNPALCRTVFDFLSERLAMKKELIVQKPNINLKNELNMVAMCLRQVLGYCRDNDENIALMAKANFSQTLMQRFLSLLSSSSSSSSGNDSQYKQVKKLLFDLFILLTRNRLTSQSLRMCIELFKEKNADYESLLSIMSKSLFPDAINDRNECLIGQPQYCLRFPTHFLESDNNKLTESQTHWIDEWIDSVNDHYSGHGEIDNGIAFRSFALAIPLNGSMIKHRVPLRCTLAYWILIEKRAPFVEKNGVKSHSNDNQMHICSLVLDCITMEIWFDFLYNRFVYRLTKKSNNGKVFCLNESFVPSIAHTFDCWNLVCVDFEERCDNRAHFIQINHVVNGGREKLLKWSYPATLFNHARRSNESSSSNCALLLGSTQSQITDFHYKLSNVFLFRQHLPSFARILLLSFGPDFSHYHHLGDDMIQRDQYFVLPRPLVTEYNVDMLTTTMMSANCVSNSSQWIMTNLVMLYRTSKPNVYYLWPAQPEESSVMNNPLLRTFLARTTNRSITLTGNYDGQEAKVYRIKLNGTLNVDWNGSNVAKTIADTGGISIFLFLLLYLMERTDSQHLWNEALELILHTYNSHYYHRFMFDRHHEAYAFLSYAFYRSGKSPTTSMLKNFAQFALHWHSNNSQYPVIIVPSNVTLFIDSWRIWLRNATTSKLFFQTLMSLTSPSNPFQSYNLLLLQRTNAFDHLMCMVKDGHLNYIDPDPNGRIFFDDSYDHLIRLIQSLIENGCEKQPQLLRAVMDCLLVLQPTEWLHVNQTKASFYYIFPSTWLTVKDSEVTDDPDMIELKNLIKIPQILFSQSTTTTNVDDNYSDNDNDPDDDWEIVSEFVDNISRQDVQPMNGEEFSNSNSNDNHGRQLITEELIRLLDKYVDQMLANDHIVSLNAENVSLFDFLIVLVNNPSSRVRQQALATFFKLYQLGFQPFISEQEWTKRRTLGLLMISNQLYHHCADERIMNCCVAFLFNMTNQRRIDDLCKHPESSIDLKRMVANVSSLENFIPLLALLPKCLQPVSLCYQILQLLHQILDKMTIVQLNELHKQYGMAQSLSKLLINVNTQLSIPAEDMNKYNREHLNEAIYRIVANISAAYNHCNEDVQHFDYFINDLVNYYAMIERKVSAQVATTFRHVQVTMFRSCFEALYHLVGERLLHPKTIVDRIKMVVGKSFDFIVSRNAKIGLGQKEKYFQRELLYHLLELIDQIENNGSLKMNKNGRGSWLKALSNGRDFFKALLNQLLTLLMSHLQSIDDRIFCLHLFYEKSNQFDQIKQFIDKHDDQFIFLMDEFLRDLIEFGVKELNIFSWSSLENSYYMVDDDSNSNINRQQQQPSAILMSHVYRKFRRQFDLEGKDQYFYKSVLAGWHDQVQQAHGNYETKLLRSSSRIFANMTLVFDRVLNEATLLNDRIIVAQQAEKKRYMAYLKEEQLANRSTQKRLVQLIGQLLHEKSCWFLPEYYPQSWELSPFESQGRVRTKMERCFLEMDDRYVMMTENTIQLRSKQLFAAFMDDPVRSSAANFFSTNTELNRRLQPKEKDGPCLDNDGDDDDDDDDALLFTLPANVILYDDQIEGEILVKRNRIQFICNLSQCDRGRRFDSFSSKRAFFQNFSIDLDEIQELIKCRYELQNKAIEIVLTSGLTYLIAFESSGARDECHHHLMQNRDLLVNLNDSINLVSLTQMWRERRLSNFDYLMQLNRLSGRTFNDLMQYPVFPFVLADYSSDILNLLDGHCYRNLAKPIAVQKKEREKYYIEQYRYIEAENRHLHQPKARKGDVIPFPGVTSTPYHYGAHYSNSGIVLYYLVRLPPYTQMFLHYQDRNFDIPDRSFHSIQTTWRLATEDSTNGFKEMIPEFFYLPEFLCNSERFNLGVRQNGERVNDVRLPPWSRGNARLFTMINRQALESNYVTKHLNHWFDLIFGYKQNGPAAVDAINVFHPATHFTADLSKIEDQVKRYALKTMIKTYGQMPSQLFQMPHPAIQTEVALPIESNNVIAMNEVIGLKWGDYVGSPIYQTPVVCFHKRFSFRIDRLVALPTNDLLLLPPNSSPLVAYNAARNQFINTSYIIFYALCSWSPQHNAIWFRNQQDKRLFYAENSLLDEICVCQSIPDYEWILVGYRSGTVIAFELKFDKQYDLHAIQLKDRPSLFIGHESAITSITINRNFNVALSTDSNGRCIVWDMNKQQYLRTILDTNHNVTVAMSTISNTLGDMAVVTYGKKELTSQLYVFTLNGQPVADIHTNRSEPHITSICYSSCPEGISVNVIATGLSDGSIKLWSSWDLTLIRTIHSQFISSNSFSSPIIGMCYSYKCDLLYLLNRDNCLVALKNG